ncbi:MAG: trypsin-like serine protease [Deltaproteobacteria bacterium]|nr:trypsin-like serine protease [Deltaproteobacteria bacterium]
MRRLLPLALSAMAVGCSPAGEVSATSAPIVGGAPDDGDPAVVGLVGRSLRCLRDRPAATCTGTLIAPRVVLTAAHCLFNRRPSDVRVFFGKDSAGAGVFADVDDGRVHPSFDRATGAWDVALLRLAKPASAVPVALAAAPLDATWVGSEVRIVGFGVDDAKIAGTKRTGTAQVSSVEEVAFRYQPAPAMTCSGDSGGPVLFDDGSGERLIGVTRSGDEACTETGTALRVDALRSFIDPFVSAAEAAPSRPLFDRGVDECTASCTSDDECPAAMSCLPERSGTRRCGLPSLLGGRLGAACASDAECGAGTCVALGDDCRCFAPCGAPTPPADPDSGCDFSRRGDTSPFTLGALLLAALARGIRSGTGRSVP